MSNLPCLTRVSTAEDGGRRPGPRRFRLSLPRFRGRAFVSKKKTHLSPSRGKRQETAIPAVAAQNEHLPTNLLPPFLSKLLPAFHKRHPPLLRRPHNQRDNLRHPPQPPSRRLVHTRTRPIRRQPLLYLRAQNAAMSWPLWAYRVTCTMLSSDVYGSGTQVVEGDVCLLPEVEDGKGGCYEGCL